MEAKYSSKTHLSVLIIDDHILFRDGLTLMFRVYEESTASAVDCTEALISVRKLKPDVVIIGLGTKHYDCWSTVQNICNEFPKLPLLILDDIVRTRNIRKTLVLKICGYWTKHATFDQLADAIRLLVSDEHSFCPEVDQYLFRTRHGLRYHPAHTSNPLQMLTSRETELLTLLAQGHTIKKCSQMMGITINTVDNHKTRLMRKLGVHKNVDLARLALREGLIAEE
jgi:DNA-binding NarL/FixJ family response regulator